MERDNQKPTVSINSTVLELYKIFTEGHFKEGDIELKTGNCANCTFYIDGVVKKGEQYSVRISEENSKGKRQISDLGANFYPAATSLEEVLGDYCSCH